MAYGNYSVVDCDGHVVESIPEIAEFMSERLKGHALKPSRNRQGVFPSLDGMHFALHEGKGTAKKRVTASEYRPGSAEDWLAFLESAKIERTVLFTFRSALSRYRDTRSKCVAPITIMSITNLPNG